MSEIIENKIKIVNTDNLNFRKEPSIDYEIIQSLSKNSEVEILPQLAGWTLVRYKDTIGFVSSKYLSDKTTDINQITTSANVDKIIEYTKTLLGKKYVWADEGPNTFDCSVFTWYVHKNIANNQFIHSSSSQDKVVITQLDNNYYSNAFVNGRRVLK